LDAEAAVFLPYFDSIAQATGSFEKMKKAFLPRTLLPSYSE
jgi:hypothetical protein